MEIIMAIRFKECRYCHGDLVDEQEDYGTVWRCLQCGRLNVPMKSVMTISERREFIKEHKQDIIVCFLTEGREALNEKYSINAYSWRGRNGLENRWKKDIEITAKKIGVKYEMKPIRKYRQKKLKSPGWYDGYRQCLIDLKKKFGEVFVDMYNSMREDK
jgi:hypothetical protein